MKIPIYQVDAFTDALFGGNPAAICLLEDWPTDDQMQKIAMENNLAETSFLVKDDGAYHIRWFTPAVEVKLCGHATLAAAHVLFANGEQSAGELVFHSKSGPLKVTRGNEMLTLDFPVSSLEEVHLVPQGIFGGLQIDSAPVFKTAFDYMVVLPSQKALEGIQPDMKTISQVEARGVIVTAPGDESDFVSRCFFPQSGIDEDPVTGSAHTALVPYWAQRLGKKRLSAIQISKRRGYLDCELAGDRVYISGKAVLYMKGEIYVS